MKPDNYEYICPLCLECFPDESDLPSHLGYGHEIMIDTVEDMYRRMKVMGLGKSDFKNPEYVDTESE